MSVYRHINLESQASVFWVTKRPDIRKAKEKKVNNQQTKTRRQIDLETRPINVKHWNSQKIYYKQVKNVFIRSASL